MLGRIKSLVTVYGMVDQQRLRIISHFALGPHPSACQPSLTFGPLIRAIFRFQSGLTPVANRDSRTANANGCYHSGHSQCISALLYRALPTSAAAGVRFVFVQGGRF